MGRRLFRRELLSRRLRLALERGDASERRVEPRLTPERAFVSRERVAVLVVEPRLAALELVPLERLLEPFVERIVVAIAPRAALTDERSSSPRLNASFARATRRRAPRRRAPRRAKIARSPVLPERPRTTR